MNDEPYLIDTSAILTAAYARQHQAIILHKDPEFEALAGQVRLEALPYKPTSQP